MNLRQLIQVDTSAETEQRVAALKEQLAQDANQGQSSLSVQHWPAPEHASGLLKNLFFVGQTTQTPSGFYFGVFSVDLFVKRLDNHFKYHPQHKSALEHVYLFGTDLGVSNYCVNDSFAQSIADQLAQCGFTKLKVHALAYEKKKSNEKFQIAVNEQGLVSMQVDDRILAHCLPVLTRKQHSSLELFSWSENTFIPGEDYQQRKRRLCQDVVAGYMHRVARRNHHAKVLPVMCQYIEAAEKLSQDPRQSAILTVLKNLQQVMLEQSEDIQVLANQMLCDKKLPLHDLGLQVLITQLSKKRVPVFETSAVMFQATKPPALFKTKVPAPIDGLQKYIETLDGEIAVLRGKQKWYSLFIKHEIKTKTLKRESAVRVSQADVRGMTRAARRELRKTEATWKFYNSSTGFWFRSRYERVLREMVGQAVVPVKQKMILSR